MRESKLKNSLKKLNEKERKQFDKFIQSPYFNTNNTVIQFWKYLKKYAPTFDSPKLEPRKIHHKLFPKEVYDDHRLRQLRSLLLKLVQRFLVIERLEIEKQESAILLAKVYRSKKQFPELKKLILTQSSSLQQENTLDFFRRNLFWNTQQYQLEKESKIIGNATSIKNIDAALDLYFMGAKLKHACELVSWNNIMNTSYNIFLLEALLEKSQSSQDLPVFHQLYAAALNLIIKKTTDTYNFFKRLYYEIGFPLEKQDRVILLTYLLNFTFSKIQQNDEEYIKEAFNLYKFGIDNKLFLLENIFFSDHLTNLVYIACALRELDWVENILIQLEKQMQLGNLKLNQSHLYLSKGRVAFEKGNYELTLEVLDNVNTKHQIHSFGSRYMSLACYVELQYSIPFIEAKCESFVVFVSRRFSNKIVKVEGSKNFVWVVKELIKEKPNKEKILARLNSNARFIFKKWLCKKVNDLV